MLLAVAWPVGLAAGATWIAVAALFRFSSLAALTAAAPGAALRLLVHAPVRRAGRLAAVGMAVLIFMRHHENIRRLLSGEEPRIGGGQADQPRREP